MPQRQRVWYWNGEDPAEEIERRIGAIVLHHNLTREDIEGWLFTDTGRKAPIRIAERARERTIFSPITPALIEEITERKIDVFILDPFVKTHAVPENDNSGVDAVLTKFAEIADTANCAIELVHHVRKGGTGGRTEIGVDDARGAGALVAATRSVRVINTMTEDEAARAQVPSEDRRLYFRVDNGKLNMAPPPERADWYQLVSEELGNQTDTVTKSDSVGVVIPFAMPDLLTGIGTAELQRVLMSVRNGNNGGSWAKSPNATDWVGIPIGRVLQLNPAEPTARARIRQLIAAWLGNGSLREEIGPSPTSRGHSRATIIAGDPP